MRWDSHDLYGGWKLYTRHRRSLLRSRRVEWRLLDPFKGSTVATGYAESRWSAERDAMRARSRWHWGG